MCQETNNFRSKKLLKNLKNHRTHTHTQNVLNNFYILKTNIHLMITGLQPFFSVNQRSFILFGN